jgi:hypothetical protein
LIRALDLEAVRRRIVPSDDPDMHAEAMDREIRRIASSLPISSEGAAVFATLRDVLSAEPIRFPARWIERRGTQRSALAILAGGALLVAPLVLVIWVDTDATGALAAALTILATVALCTAAFAGWRAAGFTVASSGRARTRFWLLAPSLIILAIAVVGLLLHERARVYTAMAAAAIATMIVAAGLLAWRTRTTDEPGSVADRFHLLADNLDYRQIFVELRDYTSSASLRERHSSRIWLTTYIAIAALGAIGAAVAGLAVLPQTSDDKSPGTALGFPPTVVATLALLGAAATAISTGLNPGNEWKAAVQRGKSFERLAREVDTMFRLDLDGYTETRLDRSAVQYVLDKIDLIHQTPEPTSSFWRSTDDRQRTPR